MSLYITDENGVLHKIAGAGGGSGANVVVDSELSETSENPVQNKVITAKLKPVLLWENANPLSSFSESYIQLNDTLLNYDFFEIGYKLSNGTNLGEKFYKYSFVESYNGTPQDMYYTIPDNVPNMLVRRVFGVIIGGSSIQFQNAEYGSSIDNTKIIPMHVYGYKGV